jgi:phosphoenolpyruvate carboxykinase (GTP)
VIAPEWEDPNGVPVDAILFGGRRSRTIPLIVEALDWRHGVLLGSIMGSETTAAIVGDVGKLRRDPFAMLPFCGYHMADYFAHWLKIGERDGAKLPKLFNVNWFRKDPETGDYLWPGFGDNSRALKWVFERCNGDAEAEETPIGLVPTPDALDLEGMDLAPERLAELLNVDLDEWREEIQLIREFFEEFGDKLPRELREALEGLEERVGAASA